MRLKTMRAKKPHKETNEVVLATSELRYGRLTRSEGASRRDQGKLWEADGVACGLSACASRYNLVRPRSKQAGFTRPPFGQ